MKMYHHHPRLNFYFKLLIKNYYRDEIRRKYLFLLYTPYYKNDAYRLKIEIFSAKKVITPKYTIEFIISRQDYLILKLNL